MFLAHHIAKSCQKSPFPPYRSPSGQRQISDQFPRGMQNTPCTLSYFNCIVTLQQEHMDGAVEMAAVHSKDDLGFVAVHAGKTRYAMVV